LAAHGRDRASVLEAVDADGHGGPPPCAQSLDDLDGNRYPSVVPLAVDRCLVSHSVILLAPHMLGKTLHHLASAPPTPPAPPSPHGGSRARHTRAHRAVGSPRTSA